MLDSLLLRSAAWLVAGSAEQVPHRRRVGNRTAGRLADENGHSGPAYQDSDSSYCAGAIASLGVEMVAIAGQCPVQAQLYRVDVGLTGRGDRVCDHQVPRR
jgi:hypothetical protein